MNGRLRLHVGDMVRGRRRPVLTSGRGVSKVQLSMVVWATAKKHAQSKGARAGKICRPSVALQPRPVFTAATRNVQLYGRQTGTNDDSVGGGSKEVYSRDKSLFSLDQQ